MAARAVLIALAVGVAVNGALGQALSCAAPLAAGNVTLRSCADLAPNITLHWATDGRSITLGVRARLPRDTAWLGVGLSELGGMKGADVWLLNRTGSAAAAAGPQWSLVDAWAPDFVRPVRDAKQDLRLLALTHDAGPGPGLLTLTAVFRRALAPCDRQDLPLTLDVPSHVIWAHAPAWRHHGPNRGSRRVTFSAAPAGPPAGARGSSVAAKVVAEAGLAAAPGVKSLDLVYSVAIPAQETFYSVQYFELPSDRKRHIIGWEPVTGSPLLHHGVAYSCPPADVARIKALPSRGPFDRFNGTMLCEAFYMLLTPNMSTHEAPANAGLPMGTPGKQWLALELHYNNPRLLEGLTDPGSGIRVLYLEDKLRQHDIGLLTLAQMVLLIPPGQASVPSNVSICPSECTRRLQQPVQLLSVFFHMHALGKACAIRRYRAGRELPPLAALRAFDYAFQGETPVAFEARALQPGDALTFQCEFDSRGRATPTRFGPRTDDEMMFAWLTYFPASDAAGECYTFGRAARLAACGQVSSERLVAGLRAGPGSPQLQQLLEDGSLVMATNPAVDATPWQQACAA